MQVYSDKMLNWPKKDQGTRIVLDLVGDNENSIRNITCNSSSQITCMKTFLKKLTLVGTMRKNKSELSTKFTVVKGQNVKSTVVGFQQDAMIAWYCFRKTAYSICFQ